MKNILLKTFLIALFFLTDKAINAQSLNANFGYTINCRTVTFADSSTTTGGIKVDYCDWDFGDGGTNTFIRNTTHIYAVNGTYTVTMVAHSFDSTLGSFNSTATRQVVINCSACNISANFSEMRDPVIDKKMLFTNLTSGQTTYSSVWDFGYNGNGGSTTKNPYHTFPSHGYYYVTLKSSYYDAALGKTCVDSITKEVLVNKLRANFGYRIDSVNCSTVTFIDSSGGTAQQYDWEFGDNFSSIGTNPTHVYNTGTGTTTQYFNVMLKIYDYDSLNSVYYGDTITKTIVLPPCNICQINANIYMGGDSTIPWQGLLYNYSSGNINKHYWNFGDGNTSTSSAPTHTYANPGTYTITYVAYDTTKSNCMDTTRVTFTIDSAGFLKRKAFMLTVIDKTKTNLAKVEMRENTFLKLYPNPASNYFKIEGVKQVISIYDLKGSCIITFPINNNETITVPTDDWPKGLYLIVGENKERLKLMLE